VAHREILIGTVEGLYKFTQFTLIVYKIGLYITKFFQITQLMLIRFLPATFKHYFEDKKIILYFI
jgi:hypothetical protein